MKITLRPWQLTGVFAAAFLLAGLVFVTAMNFTTGEEKIERHVARVYPVDDPRFVRELGILLGPPFVAGNRPQILLNGDEIFPAMLEAIAGARRSVSFETYIYWSGDIGRQFSKALSAAARRGVRTHVLLDWVGAAKMDDSWLDEMRSAGVEVRKFHPLHWSHLGHINNRTHRKLLIVDGTVGFTGGVGVAPQWTGHAQDPDHWRDTHLRIDGPVVAQMQAVFLDNWIKVTGHVLHGDNYFPVLPETGESLAQIFSSSPSGGSESMQLMYLFAIAAATRTIDLSAAYFVPDELTQQALLDALHRGVRLRVIVPGEHIDSETTRSASKAQWGPLLFAGATIAEYGPTMFHCKEMIVDDLLVSLGSTNFDNRSFRLNDEATLNVVDRKFAAEQTKIFDADLGRSRVVSIFAWTSRPWQERVGEFFSRLIASQV